MSGVAEGAIRLIARTLPPTIRERHREEWLADAAEAREAGIRPGSIALGAAAFSATLDRSLPEIAGYPRPELARRHARWALAIAGLIVVVMQSRMWEPFNAVWLPVALVMIVVVLSHLWSAARLSSGIARTSAALVTTGLVVLAAAATIPIVVSDAVPGSRYLPVAATGLLVVGFVLGMTVWGRALGRLGVVLLAASATVGFVLASGWIQLPPPLGPSLLAVVVLAATPVLLFLRRRGERTASNDGRGVRVVAVVFALLMSASLAYELLAQLVLNPLAKAPHLPLQQIYATLPAGALATGLRDIMIGAVASAVCIVGYLIVMLVTSRRTRAGDRRWVVAVGAALLALVAIAAGSAGLTLTMALVEEFHSFAYFGAWNVVVTSAALAVAIVALIGPSPSRAAIAAEPTAP
jgi:hypothetical protein